MSSSAGQSVAVRLSPKTIDIINALAEKTEYTPSRIAFIMIDASLPAIEKIRTSYESGILSIARWIDKLLSWTFKGVRKKAVKVVTEAYEKETLKPPPKETFTVWIQNETIERIDAIAKRFYMTRGRLVAMLLEGTMNQFSFKTGVSIAAFHDFVTKTGKELNEVLSTDGSEEAGDQN
jgi:predicted transcriptional regulator